MEESCWKYKGECLETAPEGYYGFIYCITDNNNKKYWGKKAFTHSRKTVLSKKRRVGTRKRFETKTIDSKWNKYWGSSKDLLEYIRENGTDGFKREIVKLCENKSSLTYWELVTLIENKVLFRDDCYNGNILGKFYKNKIHD